MLCPHQTVELRCKSLSLVLSALNPSDSHWGPHHWFLALRSSNNKPTFPGSPACRQQIMGLFSFHNYVCQYPILNPFRCPMPHASTSSCCILLALPPYIFTGAFSLTESTRKRSQLERCNCQVNLTRCPRKKERVSKPGRALLDY